MLCTDLNYILLDTFLICCNIRLPHGFKPFSSPVLYVFYNGRDMVSQKFRCEENRRVVEQIDEEEWSSRESYSNVFFR